MSKREGFIPRKDPTKRSKAAAEKGEQYMLTATGDVMIQYEDNGAGSDGVSKHERPKYVGGFSPARGTGR